MCKLMLTWYVEILLFVIMVNMASVRNSKVIGKLMLACYVENLCHDGQQLMSECVS